MIHKYTGNTVPECIGETAALLKKYEALFYNWMILSNDTRQVIGIIRLGKPELLDGVLTGGESQFLMSRYWRKGHMKEAKKLFYPYVFDVLGVEMLYADVWEGNINSMRSLESYGYKLVGTKTAYFAKAEADTLKYIYALRREDCLLRSGGQPG